MNEHCLSPSPSLKRRPFNRRRGRERGREGGLVVPFNFKHRSNTPLPKLKGNVCLSVTKFAPYRDNVPPSSRNLSRHPLFPPLFSFYRATIKRRRVKSWPRASSYRKLDPLSSLIRPTMEHVNLRLHLCRFFLLLLFLSLFFFFFFVGERWQCRWQIFTVERSGYRSDFKFFRTKNEPRTAGIEQRSVDNANFRSPWRENEMHATQCAASRRV